MNNNLLLWNVRGLNSHVKQRELMWFSSKNKCSLLAFLETKLNKDALVACHKKYFSQWQSLNNCEAHGKTRIWILWREDEYEISLLQRNAQFLHMQITFKANLKSAFLTVVYEFNSAQDRLHLWDKLRT